ncbi:MAG: PAS domain S-box protein [Acidobacteriota bacterium]
MDLKKELIKLRKENEDLKKSEESYRNIFNVTDNAIFIYNKETERVIDTNRAASKMYGFSHKELLDNKAGRLSLGKKPYSEKDAEQWIKKAKKDGPQSFTWLAKHKNGTLFWTSVELKDAVIGGKERLISVIKDIDKEKKAETELRESKERYRTLIDNIPDGVVVHSYGKIVFLNPSSINIIGKNEPESFFLGKPVSMFVHPDSIPLMKERIRKVYEKVENVETIEEKFICTDGRVIDVEVVATMIDFDGEPASQVVFKDITEKKITEKKLLESELSYRDLFNNALYAIYIQDEKGSFLDVNDGAVKMYGYPKEFFIGKTPEALSAPGKNDMELVGKCFKKALKGEPQQFEFWGQKKSGEIFPKIVWINRGKFFGKNVIFAFSIDISEQKNAEEEKKNLERHLQHSQKQESLGILAGGIAHDFNNLLTAILGNAGLARLELPPTTSVLKNIKNIELTATRAADLCNQLLAYSGKGKFVILVININQILLELIKLLKTSIPKKVEIILDLSKDIPLIEADISQIRQVIMNLIINSGDAIGNRNGSITISTGIENLKKEQLLNMDYKGNMIPGNYVFLEISDTGTGMDKETQKKIFDPFFSTKSIGKGLGLAAVLGIVNGHNGGLNVTSTSGKGTNIKVFFPETVKIADKKDNIDQYIKNTKGSGTILIADDEEPVRIFAGKVMERAGFKIISAVDGEDTIKKFNEYPGKISLVLLDMTMPKKDGSEVFKVLQKIDPDVKVLLSSGYNREDTVKHFLSKGLAGFLQKPYSPEDLLNKVLKILEYD